MDMPNFSPWLYYALILRVVDGDTYDVEIDTGFDQKHKRTIRLLGVDAPETTLRGETTEEEKAHGLAVASKVRALLEGQKVMILTEKDRREKYGRYLATVWYNNTNINLWVASL